MRAGAGRAGGAGRCHQPPVRQRRAGQGARRPGAPRRGRHGGVRQDRHPDARRARARPERGAPRRRCRWRAPPPWRPPAATPTPARSCARPRPRARRSSRPPTCARSPGFGLERTGPDGTERLGSAAWVGATARDGETATVWYRGAERHARRAHFEDRSAARRGAGRSRACRAQASSTELLSGDRAAVVEAAAAAAGIDRWMAGTLPAEKIARLEQLKAEGRKVLMVGDGLNDAPALAAAHASLSPSTRGRHQPDGGRRRVPGRAPGADPGGACGCASGPPHGAAELRHRHRLQCRVRAARHGRVWSRRCSRPSPCRPPRSPSPPTRCGSRPCALELAR